MNYKVERVVTYVILLIPISMGSDPDAVPRQEQYLSILWTKFLQFIQCTKAAYNLRYNLTVMRQ